MDITSLHIDKGSPTPAYLQLRDQVTRAIEQGFITAGEALPSERELAEHLGIARMTVRRAFETLVEDKLVEQRQGSGTYVLPKRLEQFVDRVLGFADEAEMLGFTPGSVLLEATHVQADNELAEYLGVPRTTSVFRIARLRTADGEPLAIQVSHLPPAFADLSLEQLQRLGSLYKTLEVDYDVRPSHAKQLVSARLPSDFECRRLNIANMTPILALTRITYAENGEPFECVRSAYRGDKYQLSLDLRSNNNHHSHD